MDRGAVLITGASSGIGLSCAIELEKAGFMVFACAINENELKKMNEATGNLRGIVPVIMDVTDKHTIDSAYEYIAGKTNGEGLKGLVNNAGIGASGPLEFMPLEEFRKVIDVGILGTLSVTQAFLPLIRLGKGRIVNMGSLLGRISLPLSGPYGAAKFAIRGMTDILRLEMLMFGIRVSLMEPGGVATPIWDKMVDSLNKNYQSMPAEGKKLYEEAHRIGSEKLKIFNESGIPAEKVAKKVIHALTSKRPKPYYKGGMDCYLLLLFRKLMSASAFDRFICRYLKYPYKTSPAQYQQRAAAGENNAGKVFKS